MSPAVIDTRLAELESQDSRLTLRIAHAISDLRSALGQRQERKLDQHGKMIRERGRAVYHWPVSMDETERLAVAPDASQNTRDAYALLHSLRQEVLVNRAERLKIAVEYQRRGGWTRAFLVITNGSGHVHSSRSCSTCFVTTSFAWLPEQSGKDENEIVELAGERACTRCYPSAPVDVLRRPTQLFSQDEIAEAAAKAVRDAERAEKAAAKAAKLITMPDGSTIRGDYKTEIAARNAVLGAMSSLLWYGSDHPSALDWYRIIDECVEALAHKQGREYAELHKEFQVKAEKKHAKNSR